MLQNAGVFPHAGHACLEIGHGAVGWLGDLISWGVRETDISGIELDPNRAQIARQLLPTADLRTGDASSLPWPDGTFHLVIASTVFSSILDYRSGNLSRHRSSACSGLMGRFFGTTWRGTIPPIRMFVRWRGRKCAALSVAER